MNVKEITIGLSASFPHPTIKYATFKPHISYTLPIADEESAIKTTQAVRKEMLKLMNGYKQIILDDAIEGNK